MTIERILNGVALVVLLVGALALNGCGGGSLPAHTGSVANAVAIANSGERGILSITSTPAPLVFTKRSHFVGAFFRPEGPPPDGIFEPASPGVKPDPYPTPGSIMSGPNGYCDRVAPNGFSINTSWVVDPQRLADIQNLGVGWVRMGAPQMGDDFSHIFGPGNYTWTDLDAAQCMTLVAHKIKPVIGLTTGPVMYNVTPNVFSPAGVAQYKTAADFGTWCGAVAAHERAVFGMTKFSSPGNEINTNENQFPGGEAQIAAYSKACYAAIHAASPSATVYGFELNMDGLANAPAFITRMAALGCGPGTCYDAIAMHLSIRYPLPPPGTPCYPKTGGNYVVSCVNDIQAAAGAKVHVLISESEFPIPGAVPDEATKALAIASEFAAVSPYSSIDGMSYSNVDDCALYPTGFWSDACLIDTSGDILPGYTALQTIAKTYFQ